MGASRSGPKGSEPSGTSEPSAHPLGASPVEEARGRALSTKRLEALVSLFEREDDSLADLLDFALAQSLALTESRVGYIYFYDEQTRLFTLHAWSPGVRDLCSLDAMHRVYSLEDSGVWGEAVRQRRPILINDFSAPHPLKRGYPEGHLALESFLTVPVVSRGSVTAVFGVGNKAGDYVPDDEFQLSLFAKSVWTLVERKQEQELRRTQAATLKLLADNVIDVIWVLDATWRMAYVSPSITRLLGHNAEDVLRKPLEFFLTPTSLAVACERLGRLTRELAEMPHKPVREVLELEQRTRDGGSVWTEVHASALYGDNGGFLGILGVSRDITERKQAREALKTSEQNLRIIADNTFDWEYWRSPEGRYLWVSPACEGVCGHPASAFTGERGLQIRDLVHPEDAALWRAHVAEVDNLRPSHCEMDLRIVKPGGETVWISHSCSPIHDSDGIYLGRRGANRDISGRKRDEEALKRSLKEKTALLQEVHHRVKNNLQVLTSLMNLQIDTLADPRDVEAFRQMQHRVRSIALAHERLYLLPDLSAVDMRDYLHSLVGEIAATYSPACPGEHVSVTCEEVRLGVDKAIPLGLLLTELVVNAFQHALCKGKASHLRVSLRALGHTGLAVVEDDGPGLPEGFAIVSATTLGMRLCKALEGQLRGELTARSGPGARFELSFPLD
ncbi:hypothetical protein JCM15519_16730 [Fundidesulfovibrio butyratiphilus]